MNAKRDQTQDQILDAAYQRFVKYGFKKTAMAEIASDCQMSTANLYRYFTNKRDIGVGVVRRFVEHSRSLAEEFTQAKGLSNRQRIEGFVLETLRFNHHTFSEQFHLFELVQFISTEHLDMAKEHMKIKRGMLALMLRQGGESGEFQVEQLEVTAEALFVALIKFLMPHFLMLHASPLKELEKQLAAVMDLVVSGLSAK
ncbi:MAG: TetR/AcrR family transcriptional regulator [bacterium]|nr:TetR/AcrR family transcriptional regulator [bacterium]